MRFLVPLDGSALAAAVLPRVTNLALAAGAGVHVIRASRARGNGGPPRPAVGWGLIAADFAGSWGQGAGQVHLDGAPLQAERREVPGERVGQLLPLEHNRKERALRLVD
jgi:hypothetical protein